MLSTEETYETIVFENNNGIAKITLNRPEQLNALNYAMLLDLDKAVSRIKEDDTIRVLIITGSGSAFSAGGDVKGFENATIRHMNHQMEIGNRVITNIVNLKIPVISAINGHAVGLGFNFALAGDIIIASEKAKFSEIFIKIGVIPDGGGTFFLPRLIGLAKAKELMFTGRMLDAKEACDMGIVSKVVNSENFEQEIENLAQQFSQAPTKAIGIMKQLLNKSYDHDLQTALSYEQLGQNLVLDSDDYHEGVQAFINKRAPKFLGK